MILSDRSIREALASGRIVIDPLDEKCIQPSSVDMKISNLFRVFRNHTAAVIDVKQNLEELTELVSATHGNAVSIYFRDPNGYVIELAAKVKYRRSLLRASVLAIGKEDVWTEMQGYVYGARMAEAEAYPGVIEFMQWARENSIELCIVSHKTRHPFIGPAYDLHAAARDWIKLNLGAFQRFADAAECRIMLSKGADIAAHF